MKKLPAFLLATLMILSLVACGDPANTDRVASTETTSQSTSPAENNNAPALNPVEAVFHPATSSAAGAYATIKISADVKMDDNTAWLGLCPAGKDYVTELEADDVDVIWFNYEPREEGDPYVYACDFSSVDDGTYALVVATSDDENVGYVIIQLEMTKKGETLTFNYDNAKLKERPAK